MSHQLELEKKKYRNWVRGGLAYKYLKEGLEGFADDVVQQEHNRILSVANHTPGTACIQCCLGNLQPVHKCKKDHAGRNKCPWDQKNCNCLFKNKQKCSNKVCDTIMEEILKSHGSTPPTPNWKNTDIQKWCSAPWEMAKCFINAPGYSDKSTADDIDTPGLLHVFINNISHRTHFSDKINRNDTFKKTLQRRNQLFHSPTMELEETELNECIDDIIAILEDDKELNARRDCQQAVFKLRQLKQESFIITTYNEVEVCRDALAFITNKSEELHQVIQDAKDDIGKRQTETTEALEDKANAALQDALETLDNRNKTLHEKFGQIETEIITIKQRLTEVESKVDKLEAVRKDRQKQLDYVEAKKALQQNLVKLYQQFYVKTSISPLKQQQNNINVKEIYVSPEMVVEEETLSKPGEDNRHNANKISRRSIHQYHEIFQTNDHKHKKIYILGNVGTGKSTFCKMMIQNWCTAVTGDINSFDPGYKCSNLREHETDSKFKVPSLDTADKNINLMRKFEFLFFVPLQRMSGLSEITEMVKAVAATANLTSHDLIDKIFKQESERCLIVGDGLDEWTLPKRKCRLPHVSFGLPNTDRAQHATFVILSRPSAKGVLNLTSSECDQKVELLGINVTSVKHFIDIYLSKFNKPNESSSTLMVKINKAEHEHLEKTPLLLQQLVWLHCTGNEIGKSTSDKYSHILNIMLGWSKNKDEDENIEEDQIGVTDQDKRMQLPKLLQRFPRCEANRQILFQLAKVAFEALTSEMGSNTFSRSHLQKMGVSKDCITTLIKFGILAEENCFDPTKENTRLEFIHISYLEFFAAIYVSSCETEDHCSIPPKTVLEDLFQNCKSASDILQSSNVLRMICGLSQFLISKMWRLISDIVNRDKRIVPYRNSRLEYRVYGGKEVPDQIQSLLFDCLSECDSCDSMVSLCDIVMHDSIEISVLQRIIPENVISLIAENITDGEVWRWIVRLKQLQYMYINFIGLPHSEMELLSSLIQEAPLRCITLYFIRCTASDCEGHNIDLSKHDQLQKLEVRLCDSVVIPNINTEHLEILHLSSSSILDIDLLLNASSLTKLYIGNILFGYFQYGTQVDSVVHTLKQLRKLSLQRVDITDNALNVTPEMKNIEHIELWDVRMSLETWRKFIDSLLTLQQSVQVDTFLCSVCEEIKGDGRNYVRCNEVMFEVIKDDKHFHLRTKK